MKKGTGYALPGTYQSGSTKSVVFIDAGQTVTGRVSLTASSKTKPITRLIFAGKPSWFIMDSHRPHSFLTVHAGIILAAVFAILVTGCISPFPPPETPVTAVPPATSSPVTGTSTGLSAPEGTPLLTANLPYGVTISYPQDWDRKDVGTTGARDYGRTTTNIANFFSPFAVPSDISSYTTLAIDIDQSPGMELEQYFNLATVAIGEREGSPIQITKHSYRLKISGYKSYELDWQTKDTRGVYIFTAAKDDVYIFSFRSPNKAPASGAFSAEIEKMYKSVILNPPDPSLVKHR